MKLCAKRCGIEANDAVQNSIEHTRIWFLSPESFPARIRGLFK